MYSGVDNFNARYYDATTGRFINVDPIQDGSNWYVYSSNNPLSMVDPTGLDTIAVGINIAFTDVGNMIGKGINFLQEKIAPDSTPLFKTTEQSSYTVSGGLYLDTDTKEAGFYGVAGSGGGTPELSIGGEVINSAESPDVVLSGTATEVGGGVGAGIYGTTASVILNNDNEIIGGENSISIGLGSPVEVHADVEVSEHISFSDICEKITNLFSESE